MKEINYRSRICSFNKNKKSIEQAKDTIGKLSIKQSEKILWAIHGKKEGQDKCLQVGSSYDIRTELKDILKFMTYEPQKITVNTAFHKKVYSYCTGKDKNSEKYRFIFKKYNDFDIYIINVDKYVKDSENGNFDKFNYAEVKYAFETKALLWNPAPATLVRGIRNQERKILNERFKPQDFK